MKKIRIISVLLFLTCILLIKSVSASTNYDKEFEKACQLYSKNDFQKSLAIFTSIEKKGMVSPALYKNIGNCYFKTENYPMAIVYCERGLKLDPNNEDLNFNLSLSNTKIVDKIDKIPSLFFVEWWNKITKTLSEKTWTILNLIFFGLFLGFAILFLLNYGFFRKLYFFTSLFFLITFIFSGFLAYSSYKLQTDTKHFIVLQPSLDAKSSPDDNSKTIFILHEGTKVEVQDKINNWVEVKIPNGNIGWIKQDAVIKI